MKFLMHKDKEKNEKMPSNMLNINQTGEFLLKLKDHLKVLFQFDCADLDFGIYRIMNYKRKEIERFIEYDLIEVVEKEFEKYKVQNQKELLERIEEKKKEIRKLEKELGEKILKNGEIEDKFRNSPFAKEYLELKKRIDEIDITESIQSQVFNDLYNFFSRYYEDGDFISKRRYSSKQNKYAIPYSGEEVKLYWASSDQYYIKTGEIFKDYEFNQKGWKFVFRTVLADVESGNVKGNRRYFLLSPDEPVKVSNKTCLIKFEYRPLTDEDSKQYPVKTKEGKAKTTGITQTELNPVLKDKILALITSLEPKAISTETQDDLSAEASAKAGKTVLEKHLYKYTRKITSDFFIHKNLKEFLERELDYFIKTEVLDIESLDTEKERYFDRHLTRAKIVKNIGKKIIEFLAQIEEFQKMLWEKKKFVLKTDYVLTIDRIPEDFYKEILENKKQLKEWQELGFDVSGLSLRGTKSRSNIKLPVDTKYFSEDFKERLLEKLSEKGNLDDLLDGILIKSENWQALNLLLEKYKEKVQCIYIDPPYNTGSDEFLYKDRYQHSSWIGMMENRLTLARYLMRDDGNIFVSIDENEKYFLFSIMSNLFLYFKELIWESGAPLRFKATKTIWPRIHESILHFRKGEKNLYNPTYTIRKWKTEEPILTGSLIKIDDHKIYSSDYVIGAKENTGFGTGQKPEKLIKLLFDASINYESQQKPIVLDFFLGSGTTIAVAQKLHIKWIGIEMNDMYFGEIFTQVDRYRHILKGVGSLGRMKILLYGKAGIRTEPTMLSKEVNWQGGGFFKYHYLEQYEDSLHNIEFPQETRAQRMLDLFSEEAKSEYLMKYMLKFETEGSHSLLNLQQFESPFEYKLKIISNGKGEEVVNVDLVETFNYLIGFKVNKYKFLKENGRKYVFVFGERNDRRTAIVWRATKDIDMAKDKEVIDKNLTDYNPDEIFINGDSFVKGYIPIESEFKTLMEG